jgi:hypothetical protein
MTQETEVRAPLHPYWHGMLCHETAAEVFGRLRQVLEGHYFTLVLCNSYDENSARFTSVEVYPSQWLSSPLRESVDDWAGVHWTTPRLSMGVSSRAKTVAEAREGRPHKYVHLDFEPDRVTIDHYAPAGYRLLWTMAVERHDREEG